MADTIQTQDRSIVVDNRELMVDQLRLVSLVAEGAIKSFTFTATSGGFMLLAISQDGSRYCLHTQLKKPRVFRKLETALFYLCDMGFFACSVDFAYLENSQREPPQRAPSQFDKIKTT